MGNQESNKETPAKLCYAKQNLCNTILWVYEAEMILDKEKWGCTSSGGYA